MGQRSSDHQTGKEILAEWDVEEDVVEKTTGSWNAVSFSNKFKQDTSCALWKCEWTHKRWWRFSRLSRQEDDVDPSDDDNNKIRIRVCLAKICIRLKWGKEEIFMIMIILREPRFLSEISSSSVSWTIQSSGGPLLGKEREKKGNYDTNRTIWMFMRENLRRRNDHQSQTEENDVSSDLDAWMVIDQRNLHRCPMIMILLLMMLLVHVSRSHLIIIRSFGHADISQKGNKVFLLLFQLKQL